MKQSHKDAIAKARADSKALFESQSFKVGKYTIRRLDELNWTMEHPSIKDRPYYGTLTGALFDLPRRKLAEADKNSLQLIYGVLSALKNDILNIKLPAGL